MRLIMLVEGWRELGIHNPTIGGKSKRNPDREKRLLKNLIDRLHEIGATKVECVGDGLGDSITIYPFGASRDPNRAYVIISLRDLTLIRRDGDGSYKSKSTYVEELFASAYETLYSMIAAGS
jgi:hypothetical protein